MAENRASDLFFACNSPSKIKIEGKIRNINKTALSAESVRAPVTVGDRTAFLHAHTLSIDNPRDVGADTLRFSNALRRAMRAAPDVVLIGDVRDRDSMPAAINLAGPGHLVLTTLHANNAAESLD